MKITVIGGGPGGLYTALLTKKARPDWEIEVFERNQPDDTFGFGVVFSDETLDEFLNRDKPVFERMQGQFAYWDDVAIHYKGSEMRASGNGFCGTSRQTLLTILQDRCAGPMAGFGASRRNVCNADFGTREALASTIKFCTFLEQFCTSRSVREMPARKPT